LVRLSRISVADDDIDRGVYGNPRKVTISGG
jgi:hypothetical protein